MSETEETEEAHGEETLRPGELDAAGIGWLVEYLFIDLVWA